MYTSRTRPGETNAKSRIWHGGAAVIVAGLTLALLAVVDPVAQAHESG